MTTQKEIQAFDVEPSILSITLDTRRRANI